MVMEWLWNLTVVPRVCSPQRVPAGGEAWSVLQRSAAVGRNGAKLLGVGFFASLCGVTVTNLLLEVSMKQPCHLYMITSSLTYLLDAS